MRYETDCWRGFCHQCHVGPLRTRTVVLEPMTTMRKRGRCRQPGPLKEPRDAVVGQQTPHDPERPYRQGEGYEVQVSETCEESNAADHARGLSRHASGSDAGADALGVIDEFSRALARLRGISLPGPDGARPCDTDPPWVRTERIPGRQSSGGAESGERLGGRAPPSRSPQADCRPRSVPVKRLTAADRPPTSTSTARRAAARDHRCLGHPSPLPAVSESRRMKTHP